MEGIVDFIYRDDREDLEEVLSSTSAEQKEILKTIWDRNSETKQKKDSKKFFKDQSKNKPGQTGGAH